MKSGKKRKATTDLTASGGGSSSSAPEFETTKKICFDLLLDNWKSKELGLAEERAKFYESRSLGLQDSHVKQLEWSDARQVKKIEVLEKEIEVLKKKYQDVLGFEHEGAPAVALLGDAAPV
jgi:hypothetical protein